MRPSCAQSQAFDRVIARHRAVIALDCCGSVRLLDGVETETHTMKDGVFSKVQPWSTSRTKKPRLGFGSAKQLVDTHGRMDAWTFFLWKIRGKEACSLGVVWNYVSLHTRVPNHCNLAAILLNTY